MIYFDCPFGASGDMLAAALINISGREKLEESFRWAGLDDCRLEIKEKKMDGISGISVKFISVRAPLKQYGDIVTVLNDLKFPENIKDSIFQTYDLIFKAEGKVHGSSYKKVHLHELSSFETFLQAASFFLLTEGSKIYCSPLPVGTGLITAAHGRIPLPAPVTTEILKGAPVKVTSKGEELTTPTAAALLKTAAEFSSPDMAVEKIGYGMGKRNFLRVFKAKKTEEAAYDLYRAEFNVDDMTGEDIAFLISRLEKFSRDIWSVPIIMKKGRLGTEAAALVEKNKLENFKDELFRNSTVTGFRYFKVNRQVLERKVNQFNSSVGKVRVKVSGKGSEKKIKPEYDDIAEISKDTGKGIAELREEIKGEYKDE